MSIPINELYTVDRYEPTAAPTVPGVPVLEGGAYSLGWAVDAVPQASYGKCQPAHSPHSAAIWYGRVRETLAAQLEDWFRHTRARYSEAVMRAYVLCSQERLREATYAFAARIFAESYLDSLEQHEGVPDAVEALDLLRAVCRKADEAVDAAEFAYSDAVEELIG